jgi:hypothetical protein
MSTVAEIEAAAQHLPPAELKQLIQHLMARLDQTSNDPPTRIAGLHPGAIEMAPDFDDPLPDEFWLGKDA